MVSRLLRFLPPCSAVGFCAPLTSQRGVPRIFNPGRDESKRNVASTGVRYAGYAANGLVHPPRTRARDLTITRGLAVCRAVSLAMANAPAVVC